MPRIRRIGQKAPTERADPCHKAPVCASAGGGCQPLKNGRNQRQAPATALNWASCGPDSVPISSPGACSALIGRIMTSNSIISPASSNLTRSTPLSGHWPILSENSKRGPVGPVYSPVLALCEAPFEQVHDDERQGQRRGPAGEKFAG